MASLSELVRRGLRDGVAGGATGLFIARVAFSGLSFIGSVMLARMLGVAGYGTYTYAFAWVVLLAVPAMLGMDQLVVREVARSRAQLDWPLTFRVLRTANQVVLAVSIGLASVAAVVGWRWIANGQLRSTFLVALLLLPLITLTRVRQCALQGFRYIVLGAIPELLVQPLVLIPLLAGAYWWVGGHQLAPEAAMMLNVAACFAAFAVGARLLLSKLPPGRFQTGSDRRDWKWGHSAFSLMLLASTGVIYGQLDLLMLGSIKGAEQVGIYGVADRGSDFVVALSLVVSTALAPRVAELYAAGDIRGMERAVVRLTRATLLVSTPIALAFAVFGYWYLLFFYGFRFVAGREALAILSIGKLLSVVMGVPGMILIMTGYERTATYGLVASAVVAILLNFVLIPRWGLEGTAISTAATTVLWNVLMTILVYKRLGIHSTALGRLSLRKAVA